MIRSLIGSADVSSEKDVTRQNAAAGFVLNRYCSEKYVLKLGWLPTLENTQLNILKNRHRALYDNNKLPN